MLYAAVGGWPDASNLWFGNQILGWSIPEETSEGRMPKFRMSIPMQELLLLLERGQYTERSHCSGFCMVMPIRLVKEIGLLDEIFEHGYYEDNDFSYRARASGYRCAQCDDAFVLALG